MTNQELVTELFDKHGFDWLGSGAKDALRELFDRHLNKELPSWRFEFMVLTDNPCRVLATDPSGRRWELIGITDLVDLPPSLRRAILSFIPRCRRFLALLF